MKRNSNAAEYERVTALVTTLAHTWQFRMELTHYDVQINAVDSFDPEEEQDGDFHTGMICEVKWNYLLATIKVFLPSIVRFSDAEIERFVVHELCHVLLSAEQSCITKPGDSEKLELSTEMVTRALYNAWPSAV